MGVQYSPDLFEMSKRARSSPPSSIRSDESPILPTGAPGSPERGRSASRSPGGGGRRSLSSSDRTTLCGSPPAISSREATDGRDTPSDPPDGVQDVKLCLRFHGTEKGQPTHSFDFEATKKESEKGEKSETPVALHLSVEFEPSAYPTGDRREGYWDAIVASANFAGPHFAQKLRGHLKGLGSAYVVSVHVDSKLSAFAEWVYDDLSGDGLSVHDCAPSMSKFIDFGKAIDAAVDTIDRVSFEFSLKRKRTTHFPTHFPKWCAAGLRFPSGAFCEGLRNKICRVFAQSGRDMGRKPKELRFEEIGGDGLREFSVGPLGHEELGFVGDVIKMLNRYDEESYDSHGGRACRIEVGLNPDAEWDAAGRKFLLGLLPQFEGSLPQVVYSERQTMCIEIKISVPKNLEGIVEGAESLRLEHTTLELVPT